MNVRFFLCLIFVLLTDEFLAKDFEYPHFHYKKKQKHEKMIKRKKSDCIDTCKENSTYDLSSESLEETACIRPRKGNEEKDQKFTFITWKSLIAFGVVGSITAFIVANIKEGKAIERERLRQRSVGKAAIGGEFALVDTEGNVVTDKTFKGKWTLMYFGFTHCPDICPDELDKIGVVINKLKEEGVNITPVFVTVDPERDTRAAVKAYLQDFHPKFIGLTGTKEQIDDTVKTFRVFYNVGPKDDDGDYIVDHSIIVYLMNPNGEFVNYYGQNKRASEIVSIMDSSDSSPESASEIEDSTWFDPIVLKRIPLTLSHNEKSLVVGDIKGYLTVINSLDGTIRYSSRVHKSSCRKVSFIGDEMKIASVSKDRSLSLFDMNTSKQISSLSKAHGSPLNALISISENVVCTGDERGRIKAFDIRSFKRIFKFYENCDFISDMVTVHKYLLASSGDGTLTTINFRNKRLVTQSTNCNVDMLSLALIKEEKKVMCGLGDGNLHFFDVGLFGDITDRHPAGNESIDCIQSINDNVVILANSIGELHAYHLFPHLKISLIGRHSNQSAIESLAYDSSSNRIISCGHDSVVRFWNVKNLSNFEIRQSKVKQSRQKIQKLKLSSVDQNFFADLE